MKSIRTKFFIEKCFAGLNFLAIARLQYSLDHDRDLGWVELFVLGALILGYFVFSFFINPRLHYEPVDEMTRAHECKAQAATYNGLCAVLALFGLICMVNKGIRKYLFSFGLSWTSLFIVLGILQVIEYLLFLRIESSGDPIE